MANIKSQKKRIITNEKAHLRNRMVKAELKTATRRVKDAVAAGDGAEAYAAALKACRLFDRAASKGVIHKNQAANRKSGVMKIANTVATEQDRKAYTPAPKKEAKTGSKKADARAARKQTIVDANATKAANREKTLKQEAAAAKRKAKEAAEAAAAAEASAEEAAE